MDKKKINPHEFIDRYNKQFNKKFVFKGEINKKKEVSVKTIITSFLPILHTDWKKSMKTKKGGTLSQSDIIPNALNQENNKNFFYLFDRAAPFTNVNNKLDMSINDVGNVFPEISNYSRSTI